MRIITSKLSLAEICVLGSTDKFQLGLLPEFFERGWATDKKYLDQCRYYNYHELEEPFLVSKLALRLSARTEDVRLAVKAANKTSCIMFGQDRALLLVLELDDVLPDIELEDIVKTVMEESKEELEAQNANKIFAEGMYDYEDDYNMDNRIAAILMNLGDNPKYKRGNGIFGLAQHIILGDPTLIRHNTKLEILKRCLIAREKIRQVKTKNPTCDDDTLLKELLPDLLGLDATIIQQVVQQARDEITLEIAVCHRRFFAVHKLVKEHALKETVGFRNLVTRATDKDDLKMLALLLHADPGYHFEWLISNCLKSDHATSFLKLKFATKDLVQSVVRKMGAQPLDSFVLSAISSESEKFTEDEIDDILDIDDIGR